MLDIHSPELLSFSKIVNSGNVDTLNVMFYNACLVTTIQCLVIYSENDYIIQRLHTRIYKTLNDIINQ